MKRSICVILSILLLVGVVSCCFVFTESGSFAYAAADDSYKFHIDMRDVTLTSAKYSDGTTRIHYSSAFFGDSGIEVEINIYSSPSFPIDFAIGANNLTAKQLETRDKLQQLFTDIINFIDHVDDLSNALFDGTDDFGNVTECYSDVYLYNQLESGKTLEIAPETYEMIQLAQEMYTATDGTFNPAVYRIVDLWGFSSRIYSYGNFGLPYDREVTSAEFRKNGYPLPDQKYIDAFSDPGFTDFSEDAVKLEERNGKFYVTKNAPAAVVDGVAYEQWIDLGGIAKGYAVDVAKSMIRELGIDRYDVDAGSSSIGFGLGRSGGDTPLGVSDVFATSYFAPSVLTVDVSDCSISTSGQNIRKYTHNGIEYAHIVDGAKGAPAQTGVKSITVVVPDESGDFWATKGDCLTTALTVMGYDKIVDFISGYLKDNGIKVIVQYETLTGDRQLITNYEADDIYNLSEDYHDFEWNAKGFYVSDATSNTGIGMGNGNGDGDGPGSNGGTDEPNDPNWWDNIDRTVYYKWILIVLGSILGAGAIALIVYHFVRGKNRTASNIQSAKKDKPFKVMDVMIYMLVALLIVVLFFTLVLDTEEADMQTIRLIDYEANESLFIYNVVRDEYVVNEDNINGWTIEIEKTADYIDVTLTREFNGKERYNVMRISLGRNPSVEMIDSICGFHQECVHFDAMSNTGDYPIVCRPNRLKIVVE